MTTSPYENLPATAFWKTSVTPFPGQTPPALYQPRFIIKPDDKVAVAGSCFAQRVAETLRAEGVEVLDCEPAPLELPVGLATSHNYGVYSARFGNVYNPMHLHQLFAEALGQFEPAIPVWTKGDAFADAMRPMIEPEGFESPEEVIAARATHLESVKTMMETCDVFIYTMGLTEAWIHSDSGTVYPSAPGALAGEFDADTFELINLDCATVRAEFEAARDLVLSVNPECRFIITVSPQPLTATATGQHALVANAYTKSTLRSAAGEIYANNDNVDYFPSFELVALHLGSDAFGDNLRTITSEAVAQVMSAFATGSLGQEEAFVAPEPGQADRQAERQAKRRAERQAKRRAERQAERKTQRRADAKADPEQAKKIAERRAARQAANAAPDAPSADGAEDECEDALLEAFAPKGEA